MPGSASLVGFIAAALVVLVIPGPGVLYVVARSVSQGPGAGFVSALGLAVGALVHVAAAVAGLSAILLASAAAFGVIKLVGGAYLVYLGIRTLLARRDANGMAPVAPRRLYRLFTDGIVVSVLNPKIAVFFLAFLPQFIDPVRGSAARQMLLLGCLYACLAVLTDGTYAVLAGRFRTWLANRMSQSSLPRYTSGVVYIGLGIGTALADRK